jgi:ferredoxin-NADP reductase
VSQTEDFIGFSAILEIVRKRALEKNKTERKTRTGVMTFETFVEKIIPRTYGVKSFRFPRPASLDYKPGQYMFVTIKSEGKELTKHFSISSSPTEKDYIEFTKKLTGSEFSNALDLMREGDWARINAPYGKFTFEGEYQKIAMLSGGIGITPLISICKYCTDKNLATRITLLYGNRSEKDIAFRDELEQMHEQNGNLKVVLTIDEASEAWKGSTGRIGIEMVKKEIPDYGERVFYTCGPPAMVETMEKLIKDLGVPESQIKVENFPGYP